MPLNSPKIGLRNCSGQTSTRDQLADQLTSQYNTLRVLSKSESGNEPSKEFRQTKAKQNSKGSILGGLPFLDGARMGNQKKEPAWRNWSESNFEELRSKTSQSQVVPAFCLTSSSSSCAMSRARTRMAVASPSATPRPGSPLPGSKSRNLRMNGCNPAVRPDM